MNGVTSRFVSSKLIYVCLRFLICLWGRLVLDRGGRSKRFFRKQHELSSKQHQLDHFSETYTKDCTILIHHRLTHGPSAISRKKINSSKRSSKFEFSPFLPKTPSGVAIASLALRFSLTPSHHNVQGKNCCASFLFSLLFWLPIACSDPHILLNPHIPISFYSIQSPPTKTELYQITPHTRLSSCPSKLPSS